MVNLPRHSAAADILRFNPGVFFAREWPYLLVLLLAFFGIAYANFSKQPMTLYWIVLTPLIGIICVASQWRDTESREERLRLLRTQALHWAAVFVSMNLMFVSTVSRMMNANGSALAAMTLLALGTFTAGIHVGALSVCLAGIVLAVTIPAIAWLEQSVLFLLLIFLFLTAVVAPLFWHHRQHGQTSPERSW
jgi:hypothetical protein